MIALLSCAEFSAEQAPAERERDQSRIEILRQDEAPPAAAAPAPVAEAPGGYDAGAEGGIVSGIVGGVEGGRLGGVIDKAMPASSPAADRPAAQVRAWFPESFLWMPLVETDAEGKATVDVKVPDTLTTWRILALGQSRAGAQGGTVAMVPSTLPAYVDLVTPSFLYAGDRLTLPVQLVNQEGAPLASNLEVTVRGGTGAGGGAIRIPAYGSITERVSISAPSPGEVGVRATLGEIDAVDRRIQVRPVGRAVEHTRGGSLGGPREFTLPDVEGGKYGTLTVTAFPGALGFVRSEFARIDEGSTVAEAAYAWSVASAAASLDPAEVDAERLRAVKLRAWQRLSRAGRAPDSATAAYLALALGGSAKEELAGKLRQRAVEVLRQSQQDDGLWGVSGTVDEVLVHTAFCALALGDEPSARMRAGGAFARNVARLEDPYVAAWALASGAVEPELAERLKENVRKGLRLRDDGATYLPGAGGVSDAQATAIATLALGDADLASALLAYGFGDVISLRALTSVFSGDIPADVVVRVEVDGVETARGSLDPREPHAPVVLRSELSGRKVRISAEPAVPGLAFAVTSREYVAWEQARPAGLDLAVDVAPLYAGERSMLTVALSAPARQSVSVEVGLPAGVKPDGERLDALVSGGQLGSWRGEDGMLHLHAAPTSGALSVEVPVLATLAGTLSTGPSRLWVDGREEEAFVRVPERWVVR